VTYGNGKFVAVGDATGGGGATPTLDSSTTFDAGAGVTGTWTNNFTVTSNSNRYLIVSINDPACNTAPTSVTYNSVSMGSPIGTVAANGTSFCSWTYGLVAPAAGASDPLSITVPSLRTGNYSVIVSSWYNVNQSTPFGTFSSNFTTGTNTPTASVSATSVSGRVVADFMYNTTAGQG